MTEWEWELLDQKPALDSVTAGGVQIKKGDRVKLRPVAGGDVFDLALAGRIGIISSIEQDYEGDPHLTVLLEDDPGFDLGVSKQPGHRFFFRPEDVELLAASTRPRVLVAGLGNIFLGDDAFGVEVVRRLERDSLPEGVRATDFGIRGFDFAYALTSGYEVAILIDATARGGEPGTLYLIEPDLTKIESGAPASPVDAHSIDPMAMLRFAKAQGELPRRILLLGCEPASLGGDEGGMGLSEPVEHAVESAIARLKTLLQELV